MVQSAQPAELAARASAPAVGGPSRSAGPAIVRLRRLLARDSFWALVFLLPTLVGLALFTLGPVIAAFGLSFTRWDIVTPAEWIGFGNYVRLFNTPLFWKALTNTLYFSAAYVPLVTILSLLLAVALNQKVRGTTVFRTVFFLPVISSAVAIALLWVWLYNSDFGLVNWALRQVGIDGPPWLASIEWAMPAIIIMSIWQGVGYPMVVFLAGLQNVPDELYEAARVDGANRWEQFAHVTVPLVSPTTFFVVVTGMIGAFQVFTQTYVMTGGGPAYATLTIAFYIFQNAFQYFRMGFAAAAAYVLFLAVFLVTLLQFWAQRRWVHYD